LTTFGDSTDIEKIALTSGSTSADGVSEPTVILNKNFPKIRVPVRIKSQVEGDSVEVNGIKNSASKLSRTLLQGLFKPEVFLENNADQMIKLHKDIIQASTIFIQSFRPEFTSKRMRATLTQLHAENTRKAKNSTTRATNQCKTTDNGSSSEDEGDEEPLSRQKVSPGVSRLPCNSSSSSSSGESGSDDSESD